MNKNLLVTALAISAAGCSSVDGSALPHQAHSYIVAVDISATSIMAALGISNSAAKA